MKKSDSHNQNQDIKNNKFITSIRVASYNIRKSVGLDWKRNSSRIMDVLAEVDADIVALQEVDRRFFKKQGTLPVDLLTEEHNYRFVNISDNELSQGWHGNAILFRDSVALIESKRIALPTLEPRGAVAAILKHPAAGIFQFIGTHLSLVGNMRINQIQALKTHIEDSDIKYPTIISGDFNEWKERGKAYRAFGSDYEVITPGASFHTTKPQFPLDRFVLWGGSQLKDCCVHKSSAAKKASDHLPIYMDVILK